MVVDWGQAVLDAHQFSACCPMNCDAMRLGANACALASSRAAALYALRKGVSASSITGTGRSPRRIRPPLLSAPPRSVQKRHNPRGQAEAHPSLFPPQTSPTPSITCSQGEERNDTGAAMHMRHSQCGAGLVPVAGAGPARGGCEPSILESEAVSSTPASRQCVLQGGRRCLPSPPPPTYSIGAGSNSGSGPGASPPAGCSTTRRSGRSARMMPGVRSGRRPPDMRG